MSGWGGRPEAPGRMAPRSAMISRVVVTPAEAAVLPGTWPAATRQRL